MQRLAQLARAVYWFNPLAWVAERQLHLEQEQACDDLVLGHGFDGPGYAQHLLEVLTGVRSVGCGSAVASAMARSSPSANGTTCATSPAGR
jgi:beta-lactamase regulating signal transducer with metallopeptidase domain